jgi:hypothetical protein
MISRSRAGATLDSRQGQGQVARRHEESAKFALGQPPRKSASQTSSTNHPRIIMHASGIDLNAFLSRSSLKEPHTPLRDFAPFASDLLEPTNAADTSAWKRRV